MPERTIYCTREEGVVEYITSLSPDEFYCTHAGKIVKDVPSFIEENKNRDEFFHIHFRLLGGKGGFGSLLRSFRVNKSTNQLMCRDLNGRRLASLDEERKLRKWIEKAAQREKEKKEKQNAKYERLKNGPAKHDFNDPEYMKLKADILDSTEDAFEQGFAHFKKKKNAENTVESSSDSDIDFDDFVKLRGSQKRKRKQLDEVANKKSKKDTEEDSSSDDEEDENGAEVLEGLQKYFESKGACTPGNKQSNSGSSSNLQSEEIKHEPKKNQKNIQKEEKDFDEIDLSDYESVQNLEALGLDWLRHALLARGLKCGGTLDERAKRLFSVKGIDPENYPKAIRAAKKR